LLLSSSPASNKADKGSLVCLDDFVDDKDKEMDEIDTDDEKEVMLAALKTNKSDGPRDAV